jgi:hypothetical protein
VRLSVNRSFVSSRLGISSLSSVHYATDKVVLGDVPVQPWRQKALDTFCRDWWRNIAEQGFFEKAKELSAMEKRQPKRRREPDPDMGPEIES